jgi:hypothetical protein
MQILNSFVIKSEEEKILGKSKRVGKLNHYKLLVWLLGSYISFCYYCYSFVLLQAFKEEQEEKYYKEKLDQLIEILPQLAEAVEEFPTLRKELPALKRTVLQVFHIYSIRFAFLIQ